MWEISSIPNENEGSASADGREISTPMVSPRAMGDHRISGPSSPGVDVVAESASPSGSVLMVLSVSRSTTGLGGAPGESLREARSFASTTG